jgi:DNA-binding transcriptional regulator YiaG
MTQPTVHSPLGQLLAFTHRTVHVKFDHFKQRFSPRKLIPVNPKTTGDYLLLKRIEANLSPPEVALKAGVTERTIRAWEHDQSLPTQAQWQILAGILRLDSSCPKT